MAERSQQLLNPAQTRFLLSTLIHVDEGLTRIEAICAGRISPFTREKPDVAPDEVRLLSSFVAAARSRMLEACDRLGVVRPQPTVSGRWSIETILHFAGISFAEISPAAMRKYGPLGAGVEDDLSALSDALSALTERGIALIRETGGDLANAAEDETGSRRQADTAPGSTIQEEG
jgi:hypothetical protein